MKCTAPSSVSNHHKLLLTKEICGAKSQTIGDKEKNSYARVHYT